MAHLDWHADRGTSPELRLVERRPDAGADGIDLEAVRAYRLERVRAEMRKRDIAACFLFDAVNIRYATGARNMQVFSSRNPARYLFVALDGPVIIFEFTGCMHLAQNIATIDDVRPAITASYVAAGPALEAREKTWAAEADSLLREHCSDAGRVGIERVNAGVAAALAGYGWNLVDAQEPVERARAIKNTMEIDCVKASLRATERAMAALRSAIRPGITENELWSVMHQGIIAQGGDYVETRLLSSGVRTNPWFQECGNRVIGENELIALDTDVVGVYGYYSDFSRTFHSGPGKPSDVQRTLYRTAHEQVHHNMGVIHPGMSFREYSEQAWTIPDAYAANRYYLSAHGVGMTGEYPYLYHRADYAEAGYDGIIEPGMTLCVEAYIGTEGGAEGVKLEQQILVTETGTELLSDFPFEETLLAP
jgi:Xaa-Pro aminopeptidase